MKVVIIWGVAARPKVESRMYRISLDVEIILIEKGEFLSYASPYLIVINNIITASDIGRNKLDGFSPMQV